MYLKKEYYFELDLAVKKSGNLANFTFQSFFTATFCNDASQVEDVCQDHLHSYMASHPYQLLFC